MRKKESWMFIRANVLALGKQGRITAMQENTLKNIDYVYYIQVRIEGEKYSGRYHPDDIKELIAKTT